MDSNQAVFVVVVVVVVEVEVVAGWPVVLELAAVVVGAAAGWVVPVGCAVGVDAGWAVDEDAVVVGVVLTYWAGIPIGATPEFAVVVDEETVVVPLGAAFVEVVDAPVVKLAVGLVVVEEVVEVEVAGVLFATWVEELVFELFLPPNTPVAQSMPKTIKARASTPSNAHNHFGHLLSAGLLLTGAE